ncbi:hypothetical protein AB9E13_05820 [Rhizobium leguminosarum]
MQGGGFRPAIGNGDLDKDVLGCCLGIFDEDVEVAIGVEHAGIDQFVFELALPTPAIGVHQVVVGVGGLRIFIEILHVRVGRGRIQVEVVLLHILAVIALTVGKAEQSLLQDGILSIPEGQRKTQPLFAVADTRQTVFAPAIGARPGLVVGEVVPCIATLAVILADGSPLPFGQVGTPFFPVGFSVSRLSEALGFSIHHAPSRSLIIGVPYRLQRRQWSVPMTS